LKSFIENADEKGFINSEYPFFIFFKNKNFNKEILYSYYLEKSKETEIDSFCDLKSHSIYFINDKKSDIKNLLFMDIINYFYEYDFQGKDDQSQKIGILVMGRTGSGKSTLINYLLGKQMAYCGFMRNLKEKGGEYNHPKYPIFMKESIGFELEDSQYKLKKIIDEALNNIIYIVFYLIPIHSYRSLDYSDIGNLIKFEEYHIHYYLIIMKDINKNSKSVAFSSFRFLGNIIKHKDFEKIQTDLKEEKLIEYLERIKNKVKNKFFSIDTFKRDSKGIDSLLNQVYYDYLIKEKENNEKLISELEKKKLNNKLNFSGSSIKDDKIVFELPSYYLEQSAFLNKTYFDILGSKKNEALKIIEEAKDISYFRKIFFSYNNKVEENRKKMIEKILSIYKCKNLSIDLNILSDKEKYKFFYRDDCTEELGIKIINICQKEMIINDLINYNKSIDEFGKYVEEFLGFKLNGQKIPYDCELKVNQ